MVSGEVILPVRCLVHGGGTAEGDTPTWACDKVVAGRFKQQPWDPESRANPRGKVEKLSDKGRTEWPETLPLKGLGH